eukprot:gene12194-13450_t
MSQTYLLTNLVSALNNSETEEEKLSALLLAAQFVKQGKYNAREQSLILNSIDLRFINKLLIMEDRKDKDQIEFRVSLAMNILCCLMRGGDILSSKDNVLIFVSNLLNIACKQHVVFEISDNESILTEIRNNAFDLLFGLTANEVGSTLLIQNNVFTCLCQIFSCNDFHPEIAVKIFMNIITNGNETVISDQHKNICETINCICHLFCSLQDLKKFELLYRITDIFMICSGKLLLIDFLRSEYAKKGTTNFLSNLQTGLVDVLQSKVKKEIRQTSIKLISLLLDIYGWKWMFSVSRCENKTPSNKLCLLVASTASVEINLSLDKFNDDIADLSSSFGIMEHFIQCLIVEDTILQEDKLFRIIFETVSIVVSYIKEVMKTEEVEAVCNEVRMVACIRFLCSWMCEETVALNGAICEIASFVLQLVKANFKGSKMTTKFDDTSEHEPCLFNFIMPVLCHWSAESTFRKIMLNEKIHFYLKLFLKDSLEDMDSRETKHHQFLETVLGILLNLVVTEKELASQPGSIFYEILEILTTKFEFCNKSAQNTFAIIVQ